MEHESIIPVLAAVVVHELGHLFAMRLFGIKARSWKSSFWGIRIYAEISSSSYAKELAVSLAGGGANLFLAFLLRGFDEYAAAFTAYGIFNLLPAHFLDGGDVLRLVLLLLGVKSTFARTLCHVFTFAVTVCVWIAAVYFALNGVGAALLITVFYMMIVCFFDENY